MNDFEDRRKLGNTTLEIKDVFTTYLVELAVLGNKLLDKVCVPGNGDGGNWNRSSFMVLYNLESI